MLTDAEVTALARRPPVEARLHASRVRHWRRMLRFGSEALRAYVMITAHGKDSWAVALDQSLEWLRQYCSKVSGMVPYSQDPGAWESLANGSQDPIPAYVRLALSSHAAYVEGRAKVRAWHEEVNYVMRDGGSEVL